MMPLRLGVNVDHIATLRNARGEGIPSLIQAATIAQSSGADTIICHLRGDRLHITDDDVHTLKKYITKEFDLEMALREDIIKLSFDCHPDKVTIVPEKLEELAAKSGLVIDKVKNDLKSLICDYRKKGIEVYLFVEPDIETMELSKELNAHGVELHTGSYSLAKGDKAELEYKRILFASKKAKKIGLKVAAGHGLDYHNVALIAQIEEMYELNIGFSILSYALFHGLDKAVSDMKDLMLKARL